jgi:membrane protease subunit (stomatin/prohibitin family)
MERKESKGFVELEWVCPNCDSRNKGSKKTCASCGAPQPDNVKFQRAADEKIVTDEKQVAAAKAGADIHCGFCGTRNPGNAVTCSQCGADLKEGKAREAGQVLQASTAPKTVTCTNCGTVNPSSERLCSKCGSPLPKAEAAKPQPAPIQTRATPATGASVQPKKTNWLLIGGILGALMLCCAVVLFMFVFPSSSVQGTVTNVEWKTVVPVEEKQPVNYTNRTGGVPGDAYDVSCHTESKEVCEEKTVDQGNGFAEVIKECHNEDTEYCDYTVDEWKIIHSYPLTGNDLDPVYEEPTIYGSQRIGTATEELTVYFDTDKGEEVYHPGTVSEFQQYEIGSTWTLNMNVLGGVLSVEK